MGGSHPSTGMNRYARQVVLPEVGDVGQARLATAKVLVVGAGGLGCPALQYLVGAGVGQITVVDPDVVSLSNLHRQTLYFEGQVGLGKAGAAVSHLSRLNSDCHLLAVADALTPSNANALVADADIVLDCADSFAVSYILSDICLSQQMPMISASALGLEGYVGGFCGNAPSLRAVFPDLPQRAATCATAGVLGPVVGMIGAMQTQMAISQILGLDPSPMGQLVTVDLGSFRTGSFRFDGTAEPTGSVLGFIGTEAISELDFVVDLRSKDEAPNPVTPTAQRLVVTDFDTALPTPDAGQRAVLVCRSGLRAWQAARKLQGYWDGKVSLIACGDEQERSE